MTTFNTSDDIINVSDIIERFEELEDEIENIDDMHEGDQLKDTVEGAALREEFKVLTDLLENLKGEGGDEKWRGDWYPAYLIRESYFNDYMDETVYDCYELPELPDFMTITLDYVALRMDYSETEIDGVTYLYR